MGRVEQLPCQRGSAACLDVCLREAGGRPSAAANQNFTVDEFEQIVVEPGAQILYV
jgi:hypothetical protein